MKIIWENVLPYFVYKLTGKPRYRPDIKWDKRVWVANIFRLSELIFGREYGIRAEASSSVREVNGKLVVKYEFYTVEALLAHIEVTIRGYFSLVKSYLFNPQPHLDYRPVYATFGILGLFFSFHTSTKFLPLFGLAIALDTSAISTVQTASPVTWSHTVTGSNPFLAVGFTPNTSVSVPTATAATYNSVNMTKAQANSFDAGSFHKVESSVWFLGNPSTGSNTISVTVTLGSTPTVVGASTSYTGAQAINTADAVGGTTGTATGSQSFTVTTVADNCWIFCVGILIASTSPTITANQTSRQTLPLGSSPSSVMNTEDTNAAQTPAGSKTVGYTIGGTFIRGWSMSGASFAPFSSTIITHFLSSLGVGS